MKSYPEYEQSGIEWLGEVPAHWNLRKLKYAVTLTKEDAEERHEDFQIALENIESWTGQFIETDSDYRGSGDAFEKGDILFNKLRPYLAKVYHAKRAGTPVGELLVLRPETDMLSRFLFYRLLSAEFIDVVDGSTYGAKMPRASWDFIGDLSIPIPPLPEQRTIAAYLDRKTAQIDTLIAKKQRLIDLLQEQRTAIINRAVTQGLDPDAPMQDSGIEWLGKVPAHWDITRVGRLVYLGRGRVISNIEIEENPGEYPVYSSQTKNDGVMGYLDTYDFEGEYVTWTTDGAHAGTVFYREGKFNCTNVCGTMSAKSDDIVMKYLPYLLNLGTKYYVRYDINPKLMNGTMSRIPICLPPVKEQREIVECIESESAEVERLIERERDVIELLQELRTSLISEVVTGKIDVRDELPERAEVAA